MLPTSQSARCIAALIAIALRPLPTPAQTADPAPRPTFEVVSIKPSPAGLVNSGFRRATGGALNATNVTIRFLIGYAYDLRDDQMSGGPAWLDTDRYEVVAKPEAVSTAPPNSSPKLIRLRTQSLLTDRFHLVFHRDTKQLPVFALIVTKNGPKGLHESTVSRPDYVSNGHHLSCQGVSMATFANFLARQTGRSVTDRTGIAGDFDFTLDWNNDDAPPNPTTDAAPPAVMPFPPLLLALQDQLGLKLEPQKGPVEVIVIDRVDQPSGN